MSSLTPEKLLELRRVAELGRLSLHVNPCTCSRVTCICGECESRSILLRKTFTGETCLALLDALEPILSSELIPVEDLHNNKINYAWYAGYRAGFAREPGGPENAPFATSSWNYQWVYGHDVASEDKDRAMSTESERNQLKLELAAARAELAEKDAEIDRLKLLGSVLVDCTCGGCTIGAIRHRDGCCAELFKANL